ncbi:MAG: Bacterial regulatory protein luxR family [Bacteroidota bacterium]|jgi:DNA-binding NarL/FixJ family response regulator
MDLTGNLFLKKVKFLNKYKVEVKLKGEFEKLSSREKQIVAAIIKEERVTDIAFALGLKMNTISTVKKNIYYKLKVHSDIGIYRLAVKEGVIKI